MTTPLLVLVVLIVAVALIGAWALGRRRRSQALRSRFGPEYDRAVETTGDRREAEVELEARARRVETLEIHPLPADQRDAFATEWRQVQIRFVDDPGAAVTAADGLVGRVMEARGYPVAEFEQRAADISVDHPHVVDHYRLAHRTATRSDRIGPTTEDLRQAMVHYRALFSDLLDQPVSATSPEVRSLDAHPVAAQPVTTQPVTAQPVAEPAPRRTR